MNKEILRAILISAGVYGIEPDLVYGICQKESGFVPEAVRYEDGYRYLFDPSRVRPRGCSLDTEIVMQKTSWGVMQVMGGVLRELGFTGWMTGIVGDIPAQVDYGCRHLGRFIRRYGLPDAIAAYNAGSPRQNEAGVLVNQEYVDAVLLYKSQAALQGLVA